MNNMNDMERTVPGKTGDTQVDFSSIPFTETASDSPANILPDHVPGYETMPAFFQTPPPQGFIPPQPARNACADPAYACAVRSSSASVNYLLGTVFYIVSVVTAVIIAVLLLSGKRYMAEAITIGSAFGLRFWASGADLFMELCILLPLELPIASILITIGYIISSTGARKDGTIMRGAGFKLQSVGILLGMIMSGLLSVAAFISIFGEGAVIGIFLFASFAVFAVIFVHKLFMFIALKKVRLAAAGQPAEKIPAAAAVMNIIEAVLIYGFGCLTIIFWNFDILIFFFCISFALSLFFTALALLSCRKKVEMLNSATTY